MNVSDKATLLSKFLSDDEQKVRMFPEEDLAH